ncbi:MAG TPA: ergothioneine biosynthesis protein EgtB [Gallionella sp.]|nr:ergothioneine biosynthesis protein EgtB [Gallionella sp.]
MDLQQSRAGISDQSQTMRQRLGAVRARTESLCAPLEIEDYVIQASDSVSPPKWHLAHTTWFFETFILLPFAPGYRVFSDAYGHLFNSYYETAGTFFPRAQRGLLSRPTVADIYSYRGHVDEALQVLLNNLPQRYAHDILARVELGIEHETQHQELLLMDVKYNFFINPLKPTYCNTQSAPAAITEIDWQTFAGGIIEIGHGDVGFSFDNERPRHQTLLRDFRLANRLVSNREYLDFINDDGYRRPELWLSDGWHTITSQHWQAPLYWRREGSSWKQFSLSGMQPLNLPEPVAHLSYFEADAYARWAGKRLPTEAEWEHAAASMPITGNFLESGALHPQAARQSGLTQLYGDLWEWTQSAYASYPGFRPLPGTLGEYNGKFMSGQMVLRGGCCVTAQEHLRASYRNFFRPADRWMFSGLRLAEDA